MPTETRLKTETLKSSVCKKEESPKTKLVAVSFFRWLVRSVVNSGFTFLLFLAFHFIYGKAAGNELIEFGGLVFSVSWPEFLDNSTGDEVYVTAKNFLKLSFVLFGCFYVIVYRSAYTGMPLMHREDVTFTFLILTFGMILLTLCAWLAVYREVHSV